MATRWVPARRLLPALTLVAVLGACVPPTAPPPPPTAFTSIAPPQGATPGAADEWYWAPAPNGRAVTLGVFRPTGPRPIPPPSTTTSTQPPVTSTQPPVTTTQPPVTTTTAPELVTTTTAPEVTTTSAPEPPPASVGAATPTFVRPTPVGPKGRPPTLLILNGGDGFRRGYETLAHRFVAQGFIAIVGCWYEQPTPLAKRVNGIACVNGPSWKGMNASSVADLDALVAAAAFVPDVDTARLAILGHSYGGGVALLRAAAGRPEPVISSSGFIARYPTYDGGLPTDQYAAERAGGIHSPVLVIHGRADPITPMGQAYAFVAAMPTSNPPTTDYFAAPASHMFPWQSEQLSDRPGAPMWQLYVQDISAWIYAQFG